MTRPLPAIRSSTVARLAALALTIGALGLASTGPDVPAHEPASAEPLTVTDEVLDWAERVLGRVRSELEAPTAEAEQRVRETTGLRVLAPVAADAGPALRWDPPAADAPTPTRLVVLIHGLDEPGDIWDELAPALRDAGYSVARFDYPNDQGVADSADLLASTLRTLCASGTRRVDLVAHSMGGLVARDVLTRAGYYDGRTDEGGEMPAVDRLITVGTPNFGAPLAPLRGVMEVRDQLSRLVGSDDLSLADLLRFSADGNGEGGRDLAPNSDFLNDLNARPLPGPCALTIICGRVAPAGTIHDLSDNTISRAMGIDDDLDDLMTALIPISEDFGDGAVPVSSAQLPGVEDVVTLEANHRSMLRTMKIEREIRSALGEPVDDAPPAIAVILDRLARPVEARETPAPSDAAPD